MACRLAALLLLTVICVGFAAGETTMDCCLSIVNKRLPRPNLVSYEVQEAGKGCAISATVFKHKRGMYLCVPHPDQHQWVQDLIIFLDKKGGAQQ